MEPLTGQESSCFSKRRSMGLGQLFSLIGKNLSNERVGGEACFWDL